MRIILKYRWVFIPLGVSFFFFLIKLSGLDWGFPATLHNDESNVIRSSLGMRFGDLNPHHFDWPSFYFYINYFVFYVFIKLRIQLQLFFGVETMQAQLPFWWGPELPFFYLSRLLSNVFIMLTSIVVYRIGYVLKKDIALASLATVIFCVGYVTNIFGYYGLSDSALTFFITLSVYFSLKIISKPKTAYYILAAAFAGLATSTKYNGALTCVIILLAHLIVHEFNFKKSFLDKKIYIAAIISLAFFFIGTPYSILDYKTFFSREDATGAMWQIEHMGKGLNWGAHLFGFIPENFGVLLFLVGLIGIFNILKSKSREGYLILISASLFILYIGSWAITRSHYALVYFPLIAVIIMCGFSYFRDQIKNKYILIGIVLICLITPIIRLHEEVVKRNNVDTRIESGNYIEKNIPKGSNIILHGYRTGVYGGDMPAFDDGNYEVVFLIPDYENIPVFENWYEVVARKEVRPIHVENCQIENVFTNLQQTGPNIWIYICQKD